MITKRMRRATLLFLALVTASARTQGESGSGAQEARAQDPAPNAQERAPAQPAAAQRRAKADPTQPSAALREAFDMAGGAAPVVAAAAVLPKMEMGGRVLVPGRPAAAVLRVDGSYIRVKEGEVFSLPTHPSLGNFRVTKIDESGLSLRFDALGRELVIP